MDWIVENWWLILIGLSIIIGIVTAICSFFKLPTEDQITCIKGWLLQAVAEAERCLGSETGQMKLSVVYSTFVKTFPWLAKIISFDLFADLVDEALENLSEILQGDVTKENVEKYLHMTDNKDEKDTE